MRYKMGIPVFSTSKQCKHLLRKFYNHKIPFDYPVSVLKRYVFFESSTEDIKSAGGYCRVYLKWTNSLAKWIGNKNVLEVMSGNGMLAYALKQKKVNIIATDSMKWWKFIHKNKWPVDIGQIDAVKAVEKYGEEVDFLLMSWPPYEDPIALSVIKKMHQINPDCICIYIGEWRNGCTADDAFFDNVEIIHDISFEQVNKLYKNFKWLEDRLYLLKYKEKD